MSEIVNQVVISSTIKSRLGYHAAAYDVYQKLKRLNHLWERTRHLAAHAFRFDRKTVNQGVVRERVFNDEGKPTGWKIVGKVDRPQLPLNVKLEWVQRPRHKWITEETATQRANVTNGNLLEHWLAANAVKDQDGAYMRDSQGRYKVRCGSVTKSSIGGEWIRDLYQQARTPQGTAPAPLDAGRLSDALSMLSTLETFYAERKG